MDMGSMNDAEHDHWNINPSLGKAKAFEEANALALWHKILA